MVPLCTAASTSYGVSRNKIYGGLVALAASCAGTTQAFLLASPADGWVFSSWGVDTSRCMGRALLNAEAPRRKRGMHQVFSRGIMRGRGGLGRGDEVAGVLGSDTASFAEELGVLDEEQASMMAEACILVDREDRPTGKASKVEAHLTSRGLLLHRAFSVFLFDTQGRLLMQKRASSKHTFPDFWTNTCCSHPLWNDDELGLDLAGEGGVSEGDAAIAGAQRAAVRKLGQELGIPPDQLPAEGFTFLTKVHYKAPSGAVWGEHEVDYIFITQADVELSPNPNEVSETAYLDQDGLSDLLARSDRGEVSFTPWSRYIIDHFLYRWWAHVGKATLSGFRDGHIHRVGKC